MEPGGMLFRFEDHSGSSRILKHKMAKGGDDRADRPDNTRRRTNP